LTAQEASENVPPVHEFTRIRQAFDRAVDFERRTNSAIKFQNTAFRRVTVAKKGKAYQWLKRFPDLKASKA